MKLLLTILAFAFISCNKENSLKMASTLKAVPEATANGMVITLSASKSEGDVTQYGWQLDISSPTDSPVSYAPNSSYKPKAQNPFEYNNIIATVKNKGTYSFSLTVYGKDGNQNSEKVNVEVK